MDSIPLLLWPKSFPQILFLPSDIISFLVFQLDCIVVDECTVSNILNTRKKSYRRHALIGQRFMATYVNGWLCLFPMKRQQNPHAKV